MVIQGLIYRKWQIAKYYLQYSGLTSQSQQHPSSLSNAQKSLSVIKEVCSMCYQYHTISPKSYGYGKVVLKELCNLNEDFGNMDEL